ncbi:terminal deoxycytidyl transferase rev1 [Echinococcus multilocularis]|uniref:Terminal deoxycytidyl transferase rev1 n=1 Tax=Echinococcus multilocularis TaxID=6211 RepID=A0A0S4MNU3_ECHMU|nr:terminal deoxycytidyl transferase rev1 [Echinococcus multilocularis]
MHLRNARKLCPDLRTVPYEFDAFYQVAEVFYKTVSRFCLQIEALSCDEMYVDVTELLGVRNEKADIRLTSPLVLGALLRRHVSAATQCTATCGFGTNRLLARLATKRAKPNSQALLLGSAWRCLDLPSSSATASICELASQDGSRYLDDLPLSHYQECNRVIV